MRLPLAALLIVAAAFPGCGRLAPRPAPDGIFAPGIDPRGTAEDGLTVGHRLMQAGQYQLALDAFLRAAARDGLTPEIVAGLGTANLALGRLGQAETLLRRATEDAPDWPEAWNNLGVVLSERGKHAEAAGVFRKAYALDNGESDAIRDNLRLALAKLGDPGYNSGQQQEYRLVRQGSGSYAIRSAP